MASKSLTAVTSFVSVAAEKTVVALRCNTRGFEKVTYPVLGIIAMASALALFAVAAGTPVWVQVDVRLNATEPRGVINFGLFLGAHSVQPREPEININVEESYYIFDKYNSLNRVYAAFSFSAVAMLLCIATIVITFLNSYQTVTTWWKGPPMMYILSLSTAFSGFIAVGLFMDFYLWDFDSDVAFIDSTAPSNCLIMFNTNFSSCSGYAYLLRQGYTTHPTLQYSFALHCTGCVVPLFVTLLSWRLTVLLPPKRENVSITPSPSGLPLVESPSMYSSGVDPTGQQVLY